jgi:translocator protein
MPYNSKHIGFRWTVLIVVLLNSFFNLIYDALHIPGDSVKIVSDTYKTLFTPAGYAFAIWGVIYLAFIIYAIYQLLPAQRQVHFFDRMAWPVILANSLCMIWQVVFRNYLLAGSVAIILATLCTAIVMRNMIKNEVNGRHPWLTVPFSLFLGWICVATIANIASWLVSAGWNGGASGPLAPTITMLCIALLTGIATSLLYRDFIIPIVIAWALTAIYIETKYNNGLVARVALVAAIIALVWAVIVFIYRQKYLFTIRTQKQVDA